MDTKKIINITTSPKGIFIVIVAVALLLILGMTSFVYWRESSNQRNALIKSEHNRVQVMQQYMYTVMDLVKSDLITLANREEFADYFSTNDEEHIKDLTYEYLALSIEKGIYDQIRYIDENGMERVRINYNGGRPSIVANDNLQNKIKRYYFSETIKLNKGEIYISPLDLNIEGDSIEMPIKPMLRLATPIFDSNGNRKGVVVINYLAENLLNEINRFYLEDEGQLTLYNQNGYWLKGFNAKDEWGFMYPDRRNKTVEKTHPRIWENSTGQDEQFEIENGLVTYIKIYPLDIGDTSSDQLGKPLQSDTYYWTLMSFVDEKNIAGQAKSILKNFLFLDAVLLLIISFLGWKLCRAIERRNLAEKNIHNLNDLLKVINKMIRHDILGKLTGIRMALRGSKMTESNEMIKDAFEHTLSSIEMISQMKELEGAIGSNERKLFTLSTLFEQIAKEQNMKIDRLGDSTIEADEGLSSTFENIIRNAKMHGGVDRIHVQISDSESACTIVITDEGKGIPENIHQKIFEDGFKYGETGNTGLGLYIVKKTIERYGGTIYVENNQPMGTKFVISIPRSS